MRFGGQTAAAVALVKAILVSVPIGKTACLKFKKKHPAYVLFVSGEKRES